MGQGLSSAQFAGVTHMNKAVMPDNFLAGTTRTRLNFQHIVNQGVTQGMKGHFLFLPNATLALLVLSWAVSFNSIGNSKMAADEMAQTIQKRHGWDQFLTLSAADQARVKSHVRSEWKLGGQLPEPLRFSTEARISMVGNASKFA
eukprot:TRINITY_DN4250_c0_g1_i1.p3 TRINITY_DN4250_c0_g1~~TRINITY_DN4250_c0_g1_i1.p3  ORF type:complete len:145 (+),score=49.42 TRINITY_DN4250_c0_g1_i1:73-507(+)